MWAVSPCGGGGVAVLEQRIIDGTVPERGAPGDRRAPDLRAPGGLRAPGDLRAREDLRAQVARLERELSAIVAGAFPHIPSRVTGGEAFAGPRLLSLGELERLRDRLAARVYEARREAAERAEFESRAHALLQRMRLEPGRYKFVRLPVADLGEGGCGVWQVRPRLGLIGMLAGWWELKLSSGCPLG